MPSYPSLRLVIQVTDDIDRGTSSAAPIERLQAPKSDNEA
ncbi:hypothetical protein X743_18265 [Mesorhizobium sp. LNHC252B00]|nr:hypothetical protein X743_18265 [Mesorhizobium sp. LNHC252B00]